MIRIQIASIQTFNPKEGSRAPVKQEAYAFTLDREGKPHPHPERVLIPLERGAAPYQPGEYVLDPRSVYRDNYGGLSVFPRLRPVVSEAPKRAA